MPKKFTVLHFKRWQHKILFYLTTLNLTNFLTKEAPELEKGEQDAQLIRIVEVWKEFDYMWRNYIMIILSDSLYNFYTYKKTTKELWDALDHKYKSQDAGT